MRILMVGVNHRTAPIEVREKLAIDGDRLTDALRRCRETYPSCECVVVSTCNRVEWFIAKPIHDPPMAEDLRRFIAGVAGVTETALAQASIHREQDQAVAHLFNVCAGLDSMVLGETQILGQVKRAYENAAALGTVGSTLHTVFQQAIATARHLHRTTGIGHGRHSIASVAADFVHQVFETLDDKTVLCIGAGEIGKLVTRHVLGLQPGRVIITNRTHSRAVALAQSLSITPDRGGARPWEDLHTLLAEADVIISSTGAISPIITADAFKHVVRKRRNRPVFLFDAAVPRDIEPAVGSLRNVYLYNVDDLKPVIERTFADREQELDRCRAMLRGEVRACMNQVQHQDIGRLVRTLRQRLHDIGDTEQARTCRKLRSITNSSDPQTLAGDVDELIAEHTRRLINKVLHLPLSRLDHNDPEAPLGFYAAALRRLFDLEREGSHEQQEQADHEPEREQPHPSNSHH